MRRAAAIARKRGANVAGRACRFDPRVGTTRRWASKRLPCCCPGPPPPPVAVTRPMGLLDAITGGGDPAITAGQQAPDFSLPDASGKTVKLSDYRGKKAVVLY